MPDPETVETTFSGDGAIIGKEVILEVQFHSRPGPLMDEFTWYIHDLTDPIRNTTTIGRYTAENITHV